MTRNYCNTISKKKCLTDIKQNVFKFIIEHLPLIERWHYMYAQIEKC